MRCVGCITKEKDTEGRGETKEYIYSLGEPGSNEKGKKSQGGCKRQMGEETEKGGLPKSNGTIFTSFGFLEIYL